MKLSIRGEVTELQSALTILAKRMNLQLVQDGRYSVSVRKREKGLSVSVKDGACHITYGKVSEFCRAFTIAVHALQNGDSLSLREEAAFNTVGVMLDVSRNAVLKVETVKELLEQIALMGFNTMMLYTEDVYKMEKYPYFGYMRGAYTKEELKEMDAYAAKLGIE